MQKVYVESWSRGQSYRCTDVRKDKRSCQRTCERGCRYRYKRGAGAAVGEAEGTVVHAATDAINSHTWGAAGKSFPGEGVSAKAVDTTAVAIVPAISL